VIAVAKEPRLTVIEPDGTTAYPITKSAQATAAQTGGSPGEKLWHRIMAERKLNAGEREILKHICLATDELEEDTGDLDAKDRLALQAFIVRSLVRLGFCDREKRPIGRPTQPVGVTFEQLQEHRREPA
jgi:hypothetical protein